MNSKKGHKTIRISFILLFSAASFFSNAKGIIGSYVISGKVFDHDGHTIQNDTVTVIFKDVRHRVLTDAEGNYKFEVGFATACPSVVRGIKRRRANNELNPKRIFVQYHDNRVSLKNKWRKHTYGGHYTKDIRF